MNLDNICRACLLSSSEMFSLFSQLESVENQTQLADMLMACTSVHITSSDGLPVLMCRTCVIDLSNAYTFKLRCEKTDTTLRQYLKETKLEQTAEEKNEFKIKLSPNDDDSSQIEIIEEDESNCTIMCNKCNISFCTPELLVEHLIECDSTDKSDLKLEVLEIEYSNNELKSETVEYIEQTTQIEDGEVDIKTIYDDSNDYSNFGDEDEEVVDTTDCKEQELVLNKHYIKSGDRYICVECKASLSTIGNLHRHINIHMKKSRKVCSICSKTFARADTLAEHMKRHENTKPFECEVCKKSYSTKGALTTHMYTHNRLEGKIPKERLHECSYCKKCFMSNSSLVIHIRTHTKEKPFLCQTCGKGFATRGGVDLHQRRHTGERPFKCEFCGRGFAESSNLKVHIRAHTGDRPHLCSLCGKRFTRMFLLQLHIRTHTGEKPYACPDCPKAFAQQGDLAAHKRTHTGQRPHRCLLCDQGFIKSSGLKKHIQSKHANENIKIDPEQAKTTLLQKQEHEDDIQEVVEDTPISK